MAMETPPLSAPGTDPTPSNVPTPKNNFLPLFVILAVVILLMAGWTYYIYHTKGTSGDSQNIVGGQNLSGTTALPTLPTDTLQTYTATSSVFTVQYPKSWTAVPVNVGTNYETSVGGVNIYPTDVLPTYRKTQDPSFDWTAYVLPFNQHNGSVPMISIGGEITFDAYTNRGQYDFKTNRIYKSVHDYLTGWQLQGTYKNVVMTDTTVGGEPALVVTFEDSSTNTKVFYMIKLAKDAITAKLPMTAYFIVQYLAPTAQYSDQIANTLLASFEDDLGGASARAEAAYAASKPAATATPAATSKGNIWKVLLVGGNLKQEVNWMEFDYKFTDPANAEGLLEVIWDSGVLGQLDGRLQRQGHQTFMGPVGTVYKDAPFQLGFRLDSFTKIPSSISIGNIGLYFLDPNKPGSKIKIADVLPSSVPTISSPATSSMGTLNLMNILPRPSMSLPSNAVKIGQTVTVNTKEFPHDGSVYISLHQPGAQDDTIWVGQIPSNDVVSFILDGKVCPAPHPASACPQPLVALKPGSYTLNVWLGADDIDLSSDFQVVAP